MTKIKQTQNWFLSTLVSPYFLLVLGFLLVFKYFFFIPQELSPLAIALCCCFGSHVQVTTYNCWTNICGPSKMLLSSSLPHLCPFLSLIIFFHCSTLEILPFKQEYGVKSFLFQSLGCCFLFLIPSVLTLAFIIYLAPLDLISETL